MSTGRLSKLKILYAEDDGDDREFFSETVEQTGINAEIKLVTNGEELLKYLANEENENPNLIFIDINIPLVNGRDCVKEIRKNKIWNNTPLIVISNSTYQLDIRETFAYGANLFISKDIFVKNGLEHMKKIFALYFNGHLMDHDEKKYYWTPEGF